MTLANKTPHPSEVPYSPLTSVGSTCKKTSVHPTFYGTPEISWHLLEYSNLLPLFVLIGHTDVSNHVLLREVLYAFQGLQGQVFQWDAPCENLQLKSTVGRGNVFDYRNLLILFPLNFIS